MIERALVSTADFSGYRPRTDSEHRMARDWHVSQAYNGTIVIPLKRWHTDRADLTMVIAAAPSAAFASADRGRLFVSYI